MVRRVSGDRPPNRGRPNPDRGPDRGRPPAAPARRSRDGDRIRRLERRVADAEVLLGQLKTTVDALAQRESGVAVGNPCTHCGESLLLVDRERIYCPACPYGERL